MKNAHDRHVWLSTLLAGSIPFFQNAAPIIILLLLVNVLTNKDWQKNVNWNRTVLLLVVFFALHVLGLFWTENQSFGWFDVQIKLSFLLLPVVFSLNKPFEKNEFNQILSGYVIGCVFAILLGTITASYNYFVGKNEFFDLYKANISPSLHIGYFAMYMNFAIVILIYKLYLAGENLFSRINVIRIFLLVLFSVAIFFSTSRNGFVVLVAVLSSILVFSIIVRRKWMLGTLLILVSWVVLSSVLKDYKNSTSDYHGFKQVVTAVEKKEVRKAEWESSSVRILVWRTAISIVKDAPLLGTGTGDIKDELVKRYKENDYKYPYERKYNAHNQFLQTAGALGIPAATLLLIMILSPVFKSWKRIHFLAVFLSIIVGVGCMTESVLEVQAGVIFYAFFASLFAQNMQTDYGTNYIDNPLLFKRKKNIE